MAEPEPDIILGMPFTEYERIQRVNWSWLKHMKKSPMHFRAWGLEREREETDAMKVGRATHLACLEPEKFRTSYCVWDGGRRYGKEWDKFVEKAGPTEILTEDQYQTAVAISKAVLTNEHGAKWLRKGSAEATMLWTDPATRIECKGRVDLVSNLDGIVDLKTTRDASPDAFSKQCFNLGYHEQAAFYVDGWAALNRGLRMPYVIVAVESHAPYVVQVYTLPETLLEVGRDSCRSLLERLVVCRATNNYPGYGDGELELELPRWMQAQKDNDISGLGLEFPEEQHA